MFILFLTACLQNSHRNIEGFALVRQQVVNGKSLCGTHSVWSFAGDPIEMILEDVDDNG